MPFADDAALARNENELEILQSFFNCEIANIFYLLSDDKLSFNISEIKYLLIKNKHINADSFEINESFNRIERASCSKYLGVIADDKLNRKENCKRLCCTMSTYLGAIYKVKYYVSNQPLRMLYQSLVN